VIRRFEVAAGLRAGLGDHGGSPLRRWSWVKTKLVRFVAGLAVVAVVLAVAAFGIASHFAAGDRICGWVRVNGLDLGGLHRAQAERVLQSWAAEQARRKITLTAMDRRWSGTLAGLGVAADWRDAANRAYAVGRSGKLVNRIICVLTPAGRGKHIAARLLIDRRQLQSALLKVAAAINVAHRDARIGLVGSRIEIKQDSCGIKLDDAQAVSVICAAARSGDNVVKLPVEVDMPDVTAKDAAAIDTLLSSFTTSFNVGKRGRTHNLTLAAHCIDGTVLKPGRVFSVNAAVGPRLANRGFRTAQVYIKGRLEDAIGGGVCQVSSTIFNAVLLAGLAVKERSPHSQPVPYVRPGRDATVAYGLHDFRFANSNVSPIGLVLKVKGSRLTVRIYGSASDRKQVKLYTSKLVRVRAGSKTVADSSLPDGATRVVQKGASGYGIVLYRKITQPDGSTAVEEFKSRYAPQKAVIAVAATAQSREHSSCARPE
jgi:vancomycin resistance protein YoaR